MASHRYWKLFVSRTQSGNPANIGEIVLAQTSGGEQAAVGGQALASTSLGGWEASKAFDGIVVNGNGWAGITDARQSITYDMGAGAGIDPVELRITAPSGATITHYPANMMLLYSDDNIRWVMQKAWSNLSFSDLETKVLDLTPIPSEQTVNRVIGVRSRYKDAANVGVQTVGYALKRVVALVGDRAATPVMKTPYSGVNYISGSTTTLGVPIARSVALYDQLSGALVGSKNTGADGQFLFDYIGEGPWMVVGTDKSAEQNSVIFAHVASVVMT